MSGKCLLPLFVLVLLVFSVKTRAQNYSVQVHGVDSLPKIVEHTRNFPSQDEALAYVQVHGVDSLPKIVEHTRNFPCT